MEQERITKAMEGVMRLARREGGLVQGVTTMSVNRCVRAGLLRKVDDDHVEVVQPQESDRMVAASERGWQDLHADRTIPLEEAERRLRKPKRMAALDPGIAWFGVAIYDALLCDGKVCLDLIEGACIRTVKSDKKRKVSVADDDFQRAKRVSSELRRMFVEHSIGLIAAEQRSFARGSNAVKSMAGAWGILATLSDVFGLPVVVVPPKQIKLELCGRIGASKAEVEAEVVRRYPIARGIAEIDIDQGANNNHFFDAAAAGICASRFDQVLAWLRD